MDLALVQNEGAEIAKSALGLIPLLPLMGSMLVYVLTNQQGRHTVSGWLATAFSFAAFLVTVSLFRELPEGGALTYFAWNWIQVGDFHADFALRFDHLAAVMTLIVTGVGTLIHLYAIGYMAEDDHRPRFFSYLNLFLFAMLCLVLGDNLLLMFVGWEGVGLCSYLLIGFWFQEMVNAQAGQKAFVVNRIGDAGFILGIFLLFFAAHSVNFVELSGAVNGMDAQIIELAAFCLFIGAVGKSAQIPLFVWLPDAMAGPTPVSALIHAATMVTAGVYMITRMSFLYVLAPHVLLLISCVGALTAFLAATIAIVQYDIKKVLAYSTVSQLGYMFMALGAGAFSNGIFHVVTHAFFKACLFMAAGSVIIGCHHEQDMRHFGGLWKKMPFTFAAYLVATFAIAGFPWLSGFYSKDAILWTVFSNPTLPPGWQTLGGVPLNHILWGVGAVTTFLTAFYMTRSLVMTFFGTYRGHAHPHESPWVVTVPLVVLLILSAGFGGLYGGSLIEFLHHWTRPDMALGHEALENNPLSHKLEMLSIIIAVSGMALAALVFLRLPQLAESTKKRLPGIYELLSHKWWIDELYQAVVVCPLQVFSSFLFAFFDRFLIDGSVNGLGFLVLSQGEIARRLQRGKISSAALLMFGSFLVLVSGWMVFR